MGFSGVLGLTSLYFLLAVAPAPPLSALSSTDNRHRPTLSDGDLNVESQMFVKSFHGNGMRRIHRKRKSPELEIIRSCL